MDDEIKITTGMGAGPDQPVALPPAPSEPPANLPGQPDFLSPENLGPSPIPPEVEGNGGGLKTVLFILLGLILAGAVGALGYFVVYPMLFQPSAPVTQQPPVNQPSTLVPHQTYLIKSPAAESLISLSSISYQAISGSLQNEAFNQLADGQFKEVKISDASGQVPFVRYLSAISPAATALGADGWFEKDFTGLLYYDAVGVWPIYVAKIKSGVSADQMAAALKQLEPGLDIGNFYLISPGAFKGFKDGKVGSYPTRYNVASQAGAAFNYVIAKGYVIFATNYGGLKALLPLLGL